MNPAATLLSRLADDLKPFQRFATTSGSFLERMLDKGAREVYQKHPWSMTIGNFTLTTESGNLGPYDIPEDVEDFDGLVKEERLSRFFAYDGHSVPVIPDDSVGRRFEITLNRATGTLNFFYDPGEGDKTVFYRKSYGGLATLTTWPDKYEDLVLEVAAFQALHRSTGEDARAKATEFFNNAQRLIKEAWLHDRGGQSLQEGREPRGPLGDAIYYAFRDDD